MDILPYRFAYRLHRIISVIEDKANRRIGAFGLRVQGLRVILWLHHGGTQLVGELAECTSLEPSALSHILRRLASAKLVARERVDSDNRSVKVSLTAAGRKLAAKLDPEFAAFDRWLVEGFTREECGTLEALLDRVFHNVSRASGNADARGMRKSRKPAKARDAPAPR